jgi:hypothetical protein
MKKRLIALALMTATALSVPAGAQVVPPLPVVIVPGVPTPVTDIAAEPVWLKQLIQDVTMAETLHNSLEIAIQNVVPTEFRWALNTGNPMAMAPMLTASVDELNAYNAQIEAQTGAPAPPNHALDVAQAGMAQLPGDEADLANASAASDACDGDLCAQQAMHRFAQLDTTNAYEQKQFEYAKYIEEKKDEAAADAWSTQ